MLGAKLLRRMQATTLREFLVLWFACVALEIALRITASHWTMAGLGLSANAWRGLIENIGRALPALAPAVPVVVLLKPMNKSVGGP